MRFEAYGFADIPLAQYKKAKAASPQMHMTSEKRDFLESLLKIVIEKMKWDSEAQPDDMDEEDKASFEVMRKVRKHRCSTRSQPLRTLL